MRVMFKNTIYEVDKVSCPGGDEGRFITVNTSNGLYSIDCESSSCAHWLMHHILTMGFFDATGVDYNNDQNDFSWFEYCLNKTNEQKVFYDWIRR